jgi:uncharacterized membrane protein
MNAVYLHLVLSHVPVLGVLFGLGLHLVGMLMPSRKIKRVSLAVFTLTGVATAPLYFSGESAQEVAVKMLGADAAMIQRHEDAAMVVFCGTTLLAVFGLVGFFLTRKRRSLPKSGSIGLLLTAGVLVVLAARAANLGLQIRHPEIRDGAPTLPAAGAAPVQYDP